MLAVSGGMLSVGCMLSGFGALLFLLSGVIARVQNPLTPERPNEPDHMAWRQRQVEIRSRKTRGFRMAGIFCAAGGVILVVWAFL